MNVYLLTQVQIDILKFKSWLCICIFCAIQQPSQQIGMKPKNDNQLYNYALASRFCDAPEMATLSLELFRWLLFLLP